VLHHEHGIAQIPQALERFEQAIIVALVQADARFIQDVEHAHQPRANLRGQPDALRLAATQRPALAIQREIAQADILEKAQPGANFLDDLAGDLELKLGELEPAKNSSALSTDSDCKHP
jgi:hypothetical protein